MPFTMSTRSVFARMPWKPGEGKYGVMNYYLVEIPVPQSEGVDVERAARTLEVAQSRLLDNAIYVRLFAAGVTSEDGRLVCLIEAEGVEAVRRMVNLALLPAGRIRQIHRLALQGGNFDPSIGMGQNPGADLAPSVDAELIQDVVDMGFHCSLGDE